MVQNHYHSQSGMALVTALLYLSVLTLLVTAALSSSILESKVSQQVHQEAQSFAYAEMALKEGEAATLNMEDQGKGNTHHAEYTFYRINTPQSACGLFYEVKATAYMGGSSTSLSSLFTLPQAGANPCPDPDTKSHRVNWKQY